MNQPFTAEDLYVEMKRMGSIERTRFFLMLTSNAFREDDFTHEQVFGDLYREPFSVPEAAQYLEISVATMRRYVQSGRIRPSQIVGRSQLFDAMYLRSFKRNRGL